MAFNQIIFLARRLVSSTSEADDALATPSPLDRSIPSHEFRPLTSGSEVEYFFASDAR